jgi:ABC-type spermidine/putrescine transport system permease subunit I
LPQGLAGGFAAGFTLSHIEGLLEPATLAVLVESARLGACTALIALVLAYPAACAIALASPRWRKISLVLVVLPFFTGQLLRAFAIALPLEHGDGWLALLKAMLDREGAVLLTLVYCYLPFAVLAIYAPLRRVDRALLESSTVLGAGPLMTFWRVALPLSLPGAALALLFVFVLAFGNVIVPELLGGGVVAMLGPLLATELRTAAPAPVGGALASLLIVLLLLLLLAQALLLERRDQRLTA